MLNRLNGYRNWVSAIGFKESNRLKIAETMRRFSKNDGSERLIEIKLPGSELRASLRLGTSDIYLLYNIFVKKEYEEPSRRHSSSLQAYYESVVEQGKTPLIIDCGANIGLASIWYLRKFPNAKIISIEPQPDNFKLLCRNLSSYENAMPIKAAISGKKCRLKLSNHSREPWAWQTLPSETGDVESITIREALSIAGDCVPFITKIDIEGFETELLVDDCSWIEEFPLIVFEHHDRHFPWKGTGHAFFGSLTKFGLRDFLQESESNFSYSHKLLKQFDRQSDELP